MAGAPGTANILRGAVAGIDRAHDPVVTSLTVGSELLMVTTESEAGTRWSGVALYPGDPIPGVIGESALEVAREGAETDDRSRRAVGVAAVNALSAFPAREGPADPFRMLDPAVDRIAMVGLFAPVFSHLDGVHVDVIERDPESMSVPADTAPGVDIAMHPPESASAVIPEATVVYITGSTMVYGGLAPYLEASHEDQSVVVVGASASFDPAVLFDAGVTMVGGARATDIDRLRQGIAAGERESGLHGAGLEKVLAVAPTVDTHPGLDLS